MTVMMRVYFVHRNVGFFFTDLEERAIYIDTCILET